MTNPAENKGEIILAIDANEALDKLEAAEPPPTSYKIAYMFGAPYARAKVQKPVASAELRAAAEKIGMSSLGTITFASVFFRRKARDAWLDAARTTFVSMREGDPKGFIDKQMSPYNLETMFDDGSMIVTWGTPDPVFDEPTDRALDRKGTGNLAADYASHADAVAERRATGRAPLVIADVETAMRIETWYDSRLRTISASMRLRVMFVLLVTVLSILYDFWLRHR